MDFKKLDIVQLIHNSPLTNLSTEYQTKLIDKIKETFTNDQQQLFVASFYSYLNYDSKTEFIINLDDIWKWCGFSRKDNAKRVLEKHFIENIDYKKAAPQNCGAGFQDDNDKNLGGAGLNKENILLNINTFKKFCLKAGTKKADEIHDYYLKLEELMHEILKKQFHEQLLCKEKEIEEKNKKIELLEHRPFTHGFGSWKKGFVYLINDVSKPGHYKVGMATDSQKRLRNLNTGSSEKSLRLFYEIEIYDIELCERTVQAILQPFNIKGRREWFYLYDNTQVKYAIHIMNKVKEFLDQFNFSSQNAFTNYTRVNIINVNINNENEKIQENNYEIKETNIYKLSRQLSKNRTGTYKGISFCNEKQKWKAELKRNYKTIFLGYFETELDAAKVYNNYAAFVNMTQNTNYILNDIPDYITTPIDVPSANQELLLQNKTSKYIGVSYDYNRDYFVVSIKYNSKTYHLGNNVSEIECAKIYNQQALYLNNHFNTDYILNDIPGYTTIEKNIHSEILKNKENNKSSKYHGVTFSKQKNKFQALLVHNKKQIYIGTFENELDAAKAYNIKAEELNKTTTRKYKLNIFD